MTLFKAPSLVAATRHIFKYIHSVIAKTMLLV